MCACVWAGLQPLKMQCREKGGSRCCFLSIFCGFFRYCSYFCQIKFLRVCLTFFLVAPVRPRKNVRCTLTNFRCMCTQNGCTASYLCEIRKRQTLKACLEMKRHFCFTFTCDSFLYKSACITAVAPAYSVNRSAYKI